MSGSSLKAESMQRRNIPVRSSELPGCLLRRLADTVSKHFQNKSTEDHRLHLIGLSPQIRVLEGV